MEYIIEKQDRKEILEQIEKLVDNAINEELGISDILKRSAYNAIEEIKKDIPYRRVQPINADGGSCRKGSIKCLLNGSPITINYTLYNFIDKIYKDNAMRTIKLVNNNNGIDTVNISIISVDNYIDTSTYQDTIFHELEHLFQQKQAGKSFSGLDLYHHAIFIKDRTKVNSMPRALAECIYLGQFFEQDAYVNGMYADLKEKAKKYEDVRRLAPTTEAYQAMLLFSDYIYVVKKYKSDAENMWSMHFGNFGVSFETFYNNLDKSLNRFITKIGKVIVKTEKDLYDEKGYSPLAPKYSYKENSERIRKDIIENFTIE